MPGLWIPWCKGLSRKREVLRIAEAIGASRREAACMCMEFWEWCDDETATGTLEGLTVRNLSALHADICPQFFHAMAEVGWLQILSNGVVIPKFDVWMGNSAKRRLKETRRKQNKRQNQTVCPQDVRTACGQGADEMRTTEQKSNKETPYPFPDVLNTPLFRATWERWETHRREIRAALKDTTRDAQLKKLAAWGHDAAIAAVEQSILQGWQGLFAPRGERRPVTPPDDRVKSQTDELIRRQRDLREQLRGGTEASPNGHAPQAP